MMSQLTINEFKKQKMIMERQLAGMIQEKLIEFRKKTGYSPNNVDITMTDVSTLGDVNRDYAVHSCRLDIEI